MNTSCKECIKLKADLVAHALDRSIRQMTEARNVELLENISELNAELTVQKSTVNKCYDYIMKEKLGSNRDEILSDIASSKAI